VVFDPYHHILCGNILTGIEDFELPPRGVSTAFVSPNPASANVLLQWPGTGNMTIEAMIFDMSGRVVRTATLSPSDRHLSVAGLPTATYLLQHTTDTGIRQTTKLVVID